MNKVTIALPRVRLSFPHLAVKQPLDANYITTEEKRKYVATFLLDKKEDAHMRVVKEIEQALNGLLKEMKLKQNPHILVVDGDDELDRMEGKEKKLKNGYKQGQYILKASNGVRPLLTGVGGDELALKEGETTDERDVRLTDMFYSGCYVHAFIELSPYKFNGTWKGVSNRLHHVQFSKDGDRLGGGVVLSGSSVFDELGLDDQVAFGSFVQDKLQEATNEKDLF